MSSVRSVLALVLAGVCAAVAAPAQAQRAADLARSFPSHVQPPLAEVPRPAAPAVSLEDRLTAPAPRVSVDAADSGSARRISVAGHAAIGALAGAATGAVVGLTVMALTPECRSTGSMCGLAIPFVSGGGALVGGAVALVVGLVRNR